MIKLACLRAFLLSVTGFAGLTFIESAKGCNTVCTTPVYTQHVQHVKKVFVPQIIEIPLFQFQYIPAVGVPVQFIQQQPVAPVQQVQSPVATKTPNTSKVQLKRLIKEIILELDDENNADEQEDIVQDDGPPNAGNAGVIKNTRSDTSDVLVKAVGILKNRCAACHTGGTSKGRVQIFLPNGVFNSRINMATLFDAVEPDPRTKTARMPAAAKGGAKFVLPVEERFILRKASLASQN